MRVGTSSGQEMWQASCRIKPGLPPSFKSNIPGPMHMVGGDGGGSLRWYSTLGMNLTGMLKPACTLDSFLKLYNNSLLGPTPDQLNWIL